MKQIVVKDKKELEAKLANVFQEKIDGLSIELREILLDDVVTAFENRLKVLNRVSQEAMQRDEHTRKLSLFDEEKVKR